MKLNDPIIKNAKPREKAYKLVDGHGLTLLVNPNGGKWWRYRYVFQGREQMFSLGVYPDVTLAQAREAHQAARKLVKQGINPSAQRQQQKAAMAHAIQNTFRAVSEDWWNAWRNGKSERHAFAVMRGLERDLYPSIGRQPIDQISAPVLIEALKPIEKRSHETARRLLDTSRMIFRYAVAHGRAERNPANDFSFSEAFPQSPDKKNFARIDQKDLPELIRKIEAYDGFLLTRLALKLMLLTFVRTRELTESRWSEIDWNTRMWRIPAERMKMRYPHIVPLSRQAIELLNQIKEITGQGQYIFSGEKDRSKAMHHNTMLYALYDIGFKGRMTGHGFRGLATTCLRGQQYPAEHVELQLAHLVGSETQRAYDWSNHLPERTKMMQDWADYLDELKRQT